MKIEAQLGPQTQFLSTPADIAIYGGAAGGGKSMALIMEGARNISVKGYSGIIFRRETTDIRDGGLWDEAFPLYKACGCKTNSQALTFRYPSGGFVKLDHLQHEKDIYGHQGKQYAYIAFDELTQFTEKQFFYLLTRNRSVVVNPYMRGSCNPDPDSFLVNGRDGWGSGLISWWIGNDGFPIAERNGKIRYFYRNGDVYDWANSREELIGRHKEEIEVLFRQINDTGEIVPWDKFCNAMVKSITFIKSSVFDNKILMAANPEYVANLVNQDSVTKQRLIDGNWKVKAEGSIFKTSMFDYYDEVPYLRNLMIFGDTAQSTSDTAAYTVMLLAGYNENGLYILDVLRGRFDADDLLTETVAFWNRHKTPRITNTAPRVLRIENKSSGIGLNQQLRNRGVPISPIDRSSGQAGSKWERAMNSVYSLNGRKIFLPSRVTQYSTNIAWVEKFISECLSAEKNGDKKGYWDQVDTLSDCINQFYGGSGKLVVV